MTGIKVPCLGSRERFPLRHHSRNLGCHGPCTPAIRSRCWFFTASQLSVFGTPVIRSPMGLQSMQPKSSSLVRFHRHGADRFFKPSTCGRGFVCSIISSSSEERRKRSSFAPCSHLICHGCFFLWSCRQRSVWIDRFFFLSVNRHGANPFLGRSFFF